ncbi:hypothetical protein [Egicoccus halophilus]|uniref:Universal stress protein n=1 Tax=Egicoccus halophilus TaxID=1670830 RepID=A0A8J3ABI4_9ACTN|nr:hypothetical protein [Egicoccus halophilus]GGI09634.1 hypothetical protein GCM10011354_35050 [Egicoccus halophilus]
MGRCLIVANQTLGGAKLDAAVRERIDAGVRDFHVVVPLTELGYEVAVWSPPDPFFALPAVPMEDVNDARAEARRRCELRLQRMLERLRDAGGRAEGELGDPDGAEAVRQALQHVRVDEVLVSTLPPGLSRWLRLDLPSRIARVVDVPVTTVEAEE